MDDIELMLMKELTWSESNLSRLRFLASGKYLDRPSWKLLRVGANSLISEDTSSLASLLASSTSSGMNVLKKKTTTSQIRASVIPAHTHLGTLKRPILIRISRFTSGLPIIDSTAAMSMYATIALKYQRRKIMMEPTAAISM